MVPDAVARFAAARPGRRIYLQVADEGQAAGLRARLQGVLDVDIHAGQLSQRAWVRRLEALDILLLPYLPERYAIRTSGVFAEAVAYGLVSVVPQKSWMADQLNAGHGGGVTFPEATAEAVTEALIAASDGFPALKDKAMASRAAWRETQSIAALVDRILETVTPGG